MNLEELEKLLGRPEGEHLEFKEAKASIDRAERADYCAAIANEGGGHLLFGVNDEGKVVGTSIYEGRVEAIPNEIYEDIRQKGPNSRSETSQRKSGGSRNRASTRRKTCGRSQNRLSHACRLLLAAHGCSGVDENP